ncbi:Bifunctional protein GlmU [Pelotomaculum schinkii]|uniref:Bifunctional protein GlmU n=1 Tax=Pelotomaculum schinkii TaxID=78350 RepID=A0A4Y7RIB6_9FIRM|nr:MULTISPECIES: bifunctional UDP-N-acetylglucosamine diphosphorylase/glucosamine-1-phosphate N-acetyltransferase GlmU [Pelotomaculum]TEB08442.1 Bifunctional protein GlmU [Pelotomaculum schinkii]TEB17186.1 Bifunctional protein GlmU [Pelotomaculum sp. FP]
MSLAAVILAAGKGTRMKSGMPKVLHKICGRSMLSYVLEAVAAAGVEQNIVVVGFGADLVAQEVAGRGQVALQAEQLGTAHALLQASPLLKEFNGQLLVLCGDTPLIEPETLSRLVETHRATGAVATVLTAKVEEPTGYGRVIRDKQGRVKRIVEQKDASPQEIEVLEINTGIYCFESAGLFEALDKVTPANAQGEYYLTDIIKTYAAEGRAVGAMLLANQAEAAGINDRVQLAEVERVIRSRVLLELMRSGVTVVDPQSTFVDRGARIGRDTTIYPFTFIEGSTTVGEDCVIGPDTRLVNSVVGSGVTIQNSIVLESYIQDRCSIGPFSYIRPETRLGEDVKVGDFVEIKKSDIGNGSKVPHLAYVGDATVGRKVNIGAGTITCNYDGQQKWPTHIGDRAFIGSNTNLVAPVKIGAGATTGAGSTITRDVPDGALGVERAKQALVLDWESRKKSKAEKGRDG